MLWRRPDGELVGDLGPNKRIMPYIIRGRNESAVYFDQRIATARTDAFIRSFNEEHPSTPITVQHVVMWASVQTMARFPTMNRFVAGGRLWQRNGIWFSYAAKRTLQPGAPLVVLKRRFDPAERFEDMVASMRQQLREEKAPATASRSDREIGLIMKLPGVGRRAVLALGRVGDAFGLLPRSMIEPDPMYASVFFANLASIGLEACYHHLYEYGTIGIFAVIGRATTDPDSDASGPGRRRTMEIRWTLDERVEDGLVAGYAIKRMKQMIEDPLAAGILGEVGQDAAPALPLHSPPDRYAGPVSGTGD